MDQQSSRTADWDGASLSAALAAAAGDIEDRQVQDALEAILARVRPTIDPPDFAAARAVCPRPASAPETERPLGLIVETRHHRNLPFVVRQVVKRCKIAVQVMHGPGNGAFVHDRLADLIASGMVIPTELAPDRLNGSMYNGLFLSRPFWDAIAGRGKILVFQTDSMLCNMSGYKLDDFLEFDFIGSRFPTGGCGLAFRGRIGGFSLRDWKRSAEALERFMPERWPTGEDLFFSLFIDADGGRVSDDEDSDRFCGQRWFRKGCFALHQPNFRKPRLAMSVLSYEPGAWRLVTPIERRLARR